MNPDETNEIGKVADIADGPKADTSPEAETASPPEPSWSRRTFLKAAALGAAVTGVALLDQDKAGRLRLGGRSALAHVPTGVNCRANDVRIAGLGRIINESCNCPPGDTFNAQVEFPINNNTGTQRYCVTLHLCDGKDANGVVRYESRDILIGAVPPGDSIVTATLPDYPCGAGLVCFGDPITDGRTSCPPENECCTIISWRTSPTTNANCVLNEDPTPSKCRLQQVCVIGRAISLTCVDDPADATDSCTPTCGGRATLRACVQGGIAPFTYELTAVSGSLLNGSGASVASLSFGPTNDTCRDFKVTVVEETTYNCKITDSDSPPCERNVMASLDADQVAPPALTPNAGPDCDGNVQITASEVPGATTYTFFDGVNSIQSGSSRVLTRQFAPGSHSITATATNASQCVSGASNVVGFTVLAAVPAPTLGKGTPDCEGSVTFTASPCPVPTGVTYTFEKSTSASGPFTTLSGTPGANCTLTALLPKGQTTYVRVRASNGTAACDKVSSVSEVVVPAAVTVSLGVSGNTSCGGGRLTFTATPGGGVAPYTYTFKKDGVVVQGPDSSSQYTYNPTLSGDTLDTGCHTISVEVEDEKGCLATPASMRVKQCIQSTVERGACPFPS